MQVAGYTGIQACATSQELGDPPAIACKVDKQGETRSRVEWLPEVDLVPHRQRSLTIKLILHDNCSVFPYLNYSYTQAPMAKVNLVSATDRVVHQYKVKYKDIHRQGGGRKRQQEHFGMFYF